MSNKLKQLREAREAKKGSYASVMSDDNLKAEESAAEIPENVAVTPEAPKTEVKTDQKKASTSKQKKAAPAKTNSNDQSKKEVREMPESEESTPHMFVQPKLTDLHTQKGYYMRKEVLDAIDSVLGKNSRAQYKLINLATLEFIENHYPHLMDKHNLHGLAETYRGK